MKKAISLLLIFSLCFSLSACSVYYEKIEDPIKPGISIPSVTDTSPDVGIISIIEEENYQTIAAHYPIIGQEKIDAALKSFALNRIELFRQETADLKLTQEESWPFELHLDYEVVFKSDRHISLLFKENKYLGGAQPTSTIYTFNYNLMQGRQLALKDLFKGSSAYLEILSKYIYAKLVDDNALNITLDKDWVTKGTDPLESNFKHFLFTNGGLIIIFEKYQIGPAFIGEPKIIIPFDTFTAHIELKETIDDIVPSTEAETTTSVEVITETPSTEMVNETTETATASENESSNNQEVIHAKRVALTFEDGPDPDYTPLILDTLKSRNQVATFFVQGIRAKEYPSLIQRINAEGHLIGNHTWSHPQLTHLSPEEMLLQLQKTQSILEQITGRAPFLYRPSYGIYNENVISTINMPAILWSVDPEDLKYKDASYITNYVLDHVVDGAIILLHDTNAYTTQAISAILDALIAEGYEIVTVDELLGITENTAKYNVRIFSQAVETH